MDKLKFYRVRMLVYMNDKKHKSGMNNIKSVTSCSGNINKCSLCIYNGELLRWVTGYRLVKRTRPSQLMIQLASW